MQYMNSFCHIFNVDSMLRKQYIRIKESFKKGLFK